MTTVRLCAPLLSLLLAAGCAPQATRGGVTGDTRIDDAALSVGLDRVDIDFLVGENVHALSTSRFWNQVTRPGADTQRGADVPIAILCQSALCSQPTGGTP